MKIFIASDHGGFNLKERVKEKLQEQVLDLGPKQLDPHDDYPLFAFRVAEQVSHNPGSLGLLFCRSGSGMAIAANKVKGIRAVDIYNADIAKHSLTDNHANVFAFGADYLSLEEVLDYLSIILNTQANQDERHLRRIQQINNYEK